jgi:ubiquinone/menaquinone biosynthesis C-methylase UbiE
MSDYHEIYSQQADQYEALVAREDYQHNIYRTLHQIVPFDGLTVVEFGAGTGRLTCMLAPAVQFIHAYDGSQHMLDVAIAKLQKSGLRNWQAAIGDNRRVPAADGIADVVISGWSICYLVVENREIWPEELSRALDEMCRVLKPGGTLILLETLGTGHESPEPPSGLVPYYEYLEGRGFSHTWIRTDYRFQDLAEAQSLTRFFFGETMVEKIREEAVGVMLPECTGIWWVKR